MKIHDSGDAPAAPFARILLVDDEAGQRAVDAEVLGEDFEVLQAGGGREALGMVYAHRPDVIIRDARMPDLDGWETLRRIRDLPPTQHGGRSAQLALHHLAPGNRFHLGLRGAGPGVTKGGVSAH